MLTKAFYYFNVQHFMSFIHVEELQQQFIQNCDFQKTLLRKHTLETNTILFPPLEGYDYEN